MMHGQKNIKLATRSLTKYANRVVIHLHTKAKHECHIQFS